MLNFRISRSAIAAAAGLAFVAFMPDASYAVGDSPAPAPAPKQKKKPAKKKAPKKADVITNDAAIYAAGYWAAKKGEYAQALDILRTAQHQADPKVQTMIGFSLRKLGYVDEAMAYYQAALSTRPGATTTRQYLGEAYLQKGDKAAARGQLDEIAKRCGTTCEDYRLLADAIAKA